MGDEPSSVSPDPVIYHGTPMTPRAALLDVLPGRAGCVSLAWAAGAADVNAGDPVPEFVKSKRLEQFLNAPGYWLTGAKLSERIAPYELSSMAAEIIKARELHAALAAALSTQDQAQGSRARSAHSQPPGAQVDE